MLLYMYQKYESFRDQLPDMGWLREYMPDPSYIESVKQKFQVLFRDTSLPALPDVQVYQKFAVICYVCVVVDVRVALCKMLFTLSRTR